MDRTAYEQLGWNPLSTRTAVKSSIAQRFLRVDTKDWQRFWSAPDP